jgi:hypothetical protein
MFGTATNKFASVGSAFDSMASGYDNRESSSCAGLFSFNKNNNNNNNRGPQQAKRGEAKIDDLKEVESYLAQTMHNLSLEERDKALEDLHAIASVPEESVSTVKESLEAMSHYIDIVDNKKAYLIAKSMSANYVTNEKRRLQFLRAENYDPQKAATRLTQYFEEKLALFGTDNLVTDIHLTDLPPADVEALKNGSLMLLEKDRSGRYVIYGAGLIDCMLPLDARVRKVN